jgi:hypothetical protein
VVAKPTCCLLLALVLVTSCHRRPPEALEGDRPVEPESGTLVLVGPCDKIGIVASSLHLAAINERNDQVDCDWSRRAVTVWNSIVTDLMNGPGEVDALGLSYSYYDHQINGLILVYGRQLESSGYLLWRPRDKETMERNVRRVLLLARECGLEHRFERPVDDDSR